MCWGRRSPRDGAGVTSARASRCEGRGEKPRPSSRFPSRRPSMTSHPGTILYVDEGSGTGAVWPADEVPPGIAYARGIDGERLPITRVVRRPMGDAGCEIFSYGADATLLRVTRMIQSPRRPVTAGA